MAKDTPIKHRSPTSLPSLSNEILLIIVSILGTPDVRRLGRVNRRLQFFTGDYLIRYQYNAGLFTLPNELILEITQYLGSPKDCSRFARSSQRLYPLVQDYILRHNVRHGGSGLLNYAAKRNLIGMARMMLHVGGDINTQSGFRLSLMGKRPTPLITAVAHGHERIVRMLLEAGANQFVGGMRTPLRIAITGRHERLALLLSQDLDPSEILLKGLGSSALQMACSAKLVLLVRYYLEHEPNQNGPSDVQIFLDRSTALYRVLQADAQNGDFVRREVHEEVYQIVSMLIEHGASPDI
ncbi:hypothetical protein K504DRAFT_369265, partial [Pleomassaria siparia CBS 279.74]